MSDKNLTYAELSKRLDIPVGTLRIWVMQGRIKPVKHGRLVRFQESYVKELEEKGVPKDGNL